MAQTESEIRERLRALAATVPDLTKVLRGSPRERFNRCSRKTCRCQTGRGHGPAYYLSVSFGARRCTQMTLDAATYETAQAYAANYQQLRAILEEISSLNRELLRLHTRKGPHRKP